MRGHRLIAEAIGQMPREPFGQPAGVHEHQRGVVSLDQLCQAVVVFLPDFMRHHGFERRPRDFDVQIDLAIMTLIDNLHGPRADDALCSSGGFGRTRRQISSFLQRVRLDGACVRSGAGEEPSNFFDRLLRRGQADPDERCRHHLLQPFEREGEVRAASRADHGMNFVDDDRVRGTQHLAASFRGEQQVQRLGGRDQNVRRRP